MSNSAGIVLAGMGVVVAVVCSVVAVMVAVLMVALSQFLFLWFVIDLATVIVPTAVVAIACAVNVAAAAVVVLVSLCRMCGGMRPSRHLSILKHSCDPLQPAALLVSVAPGRKAPGGGGLAICKHRNMSRGRKSEWE